MKTTNNGIESICSFGKEAAGSWPANLRMEKNTNRKLLLLGLLVLCWTASIIPASAQGLRVPWVQVGTGGLDFDVPCAGVTGVCLPQAIAAGPGADRSSIGPGPWMLSQESNGAGDYEIALWYYYPGPSPEWVDYIGGFNAATQIASSPQGTLWVVNHAGQIFYWNGDGYTEAPGNGCAVAIGVGPATASDPNGTPWVIGCNGSASQNGGIYYLNGSSWVQVPGAATRIAVSPEGIPWVVTAAGNIFYFNGSVFINVPGCATNIAVGPTTAPLAGPNGDVWVIGCSGVAGSGNAIYQLEYGTTWLQYPGWASQISVSPGLGIPWVINEQGVIYVQNQ